MPAAWVVKWSLAVGAILVLVACIAEGGPIEIGETNKAITSDQATTNARIFESIDATRDAGGSALLANRGK